MQCTEIYKVDCFETERVLAGGRRALWGPNSDRMALSIIWRIMREIYFALHRGT